MKNGVSIALLVFCVSVFAACSIKEDRSACPSECDVYFCGPSSLAGKDLSFGVWGRSSVLHDSFIYGGNLQGRTYFVPRCPLVFFTGNCSYDASGAYLIAKGAQCDSLYTISRPVIPDGEHCSDTLYLRKNFATITVNIHTENPEDLDNLKFKVRANTCGFSLLDAAPIEGDFEYCPRFDRGMRSLFRIPRQLDDGLAFEIYERNEEKLLLSVPLGTEISASGYSWTEADLKDIEVKIALNFAGAMIDIQPWDNAGFIDITI